MTQKNDVTFGKYIRSLRGEKRIGQRELARVIGISPSYLNDIEKDKRVAPRGEIIKSIAKILEANSMEMYDLAGKSRNSIPADVAEILK